MRALADAAAFSRFLLHWHGLHEPESSRTSLSGVVRKIQGYPIPYSDIEDHVLPARLKDYQYGDLDHLCERGVIGWQGVRRVSNGDGHIAIYFKEMIPQLARISSLSPGETCARLRGILAAGARKFDDLKTHAGGFPPQLLEALWDMVWSGEASNRRLLPLQALRAEEVGRRRVRGHRRARLRTGLRRIDAPAGSRGEWYLLAGPTSGFADPATRDAAYVNQLLIRWGVAAPEMLEAENAKGGLDRFYAVMRGLVAHGQLLEQASVMGLRSPQFVLPQAAERLSLETARAARRDESNVLAATDPANPYGIVFPWPATSVSPAARLKRAPGARVIILNGYLIGYLSGDGHELSTFLSHDGLPEPPVDGLIHALCSVAGSGRPLWLKTVDGRHPSRCEFESRLRAHGFTASQSGYIYRARDK